MQTFLFRLFDNKCTCFKAMKWLYKRWWMLSNIKWSQRTVRLWPPRTNWAPTTRKTRKEARAAQSAPPTPSWSRPVFSWDSPPAMMKFTTHGQTREWSVSDYYFYLSRRELVWVWRKWVLKVDLSGKFSRRINWSHYCKSRNRALPFRILQSSHTCQE